MRPETLDSFDDALEPIVLQIVTQNASLLGRIDELLAEIKTLNARIAELEARGGQPPGQPPKTPTNSSLPPSSGHKANATTTAQDEAAAKAGRAWRASCARART